MAMNTSRCNHLVPLYFKGLKRKLHLFRWIRWPQTSCPQSWLMMMTTMMPTHHRSKASVEQRQLAVAESSTADRQTDRRCQAPSDARTSACLY